MGNIGRLFTKDAWKGPKSFAQTALDAGAFFTKFEEASSNKPATLKPEDTEAAAARELERRRKSATSTTFSGRKADALSASIGKRMLGGSV